MANGSLSVYHSPSNPGAAVVLPSQLNKILRPIELAYERRMAVEQEDRRAKQREMEQNRQNFLDGMEYGASVKFEPYVDMVSQSVAQYRDKYAKMYRESGGQPTFDMNVAMARDRGSIKGMADKVDAIQSRMDESMRSLAQDRKINRANFANLFTLATRDPQGNLIPPDKFSVDQAIEQVLSNPAAYNKQQVISDFVDSIPDLIQGHVASHTGTRDEIKVKSRFYETNADGTIQYDDNNQPKYKITPELVNAFKSTPGGVPLLNEEMQRLRAEGYEGTDGELERAATKNLVAPYAKYERTVNRENERAGAATGGSAFDSKNYSQEDFEYRDRTIRSIIGAFGSGALSEEARDAVGEMVGSTKHGKGIIERVEFIEPAVVAPGTDELGSARDIPKTDSGKIVVVWRDSTSSTADERVEEFSLDDPKLYTMLSSILDSKIQGARKLPPAKVDQYRKMKDREQPKPAGVVDPGEARKRADRLLKELEESGVTLF